MHYTRSLKFEDRPDYSFLKKMFKELMIKKNLEYDYVFDWTFPDIPKRQPIRLGQQRSLALNPHSRTHIQSHPQ